MLHTARSYRGMVTAPHHLATRAGLRVLEEGGNAIEAVIATASTIAVAYPHMNGLGGDNFWLISAPGQDVVGIDACGGAAQAASIDFYKDKGYSDIPSRGPLSALTVAGSVSGWQQAHNISSQQWGGRLALDRLLEDAVFYAENGISVTQTLASNIEVKQPELEDIPGFIQTYCVEGKAPILGARFTQPRLAEFLKQLIHQGLDSFYRGELAQQIATDLSNAGSPLRLADLQRHQAQIVNPLCLELAGHQIFNMPPPTQGLASLILLGIYDRLNITNAESFEYIHGLVEATKRAFRVRDRYVTDPAYMDIDPAMYLTDSKLTEMAADIDPHTALPWPEANSNGDTVWFGAIDSEGRAVSCIQSLYWEFGSGVVLSNSGIGWQNRGISFSLDQHHHNCLQPFRRPFHTIQPALARLNDGSTMVYGTMGGEGQPQTQAMLFSRHVLHGQDLQDSVTAPRWLLGRTWGAESTSLKVENRFDSSLLERLRQAGHNLEVMGAFEEVMGHAGAIVRTPGGLFEGASDPRSDGLAQGF